MPPYLKRLPPLLVLVLLLGACSQVSLAYRNLDWLIPWRLNQYLDLDSRQKAWLKPRLQSHLAWHCSSELPRYLDWLQRTQGLLQSPHPDARQLDAQLVEAESAVQNIVRQINPTALELLQQLSAEQVAGLYAAMEKDNREDRQKYLRPALSTQIAERAERLEKRLRPWLGGLNEVQRARVQQWASERREQNRLWLENRSRWQSAFRSALDQRESPQFAERMTLVLENRRGAHDEQAALAYQRSRQAMAELFSDLLDAADSGQRERLNKRFETLRRDLQAQVCSSGGSEVGQTPVDGAQAMLLEELVGAAEMPVAEEAAMSRQGRWMR